MALTIVFRQNEKLTLIDAILIMVDGIKYLEISELGRPIKIKGCDDLVPKLSKVFRDFSFQVRNNACKHSPIISFQKTQAGYERNSIWLDKAVTYIDPLDAVCDLSVDIIHSYVGDNPGTLCLHCAAVKINEGLLIFPSTYRAGKSLLTMQFAALGHQIYTDDALCLLKNGLGKCLGISPRMRLPIPDTCSLELKKVIDSQGVFRNTRYCYINLESNEMPLHGTSAPINGIVLLERSESSTKIKLNQIQRSEVLTELILRNFARQNPAIDIIERLTQLVNDVPFGTYKMTYNNPYDAVEMIIKTFT